MFCLGLIYKLDPPTARSWWEKAVKTANHAESMDMLAELSEEDGDLAQARQWRQRSTDARNAKD